MKVNGRIKVRCPRCDRMIYIRKLIKSPVNHEHICQTCYYFENRKRNHPLLYGKQYKEIDYDRNAVRLSNFSKVGYF